MLEEGQVYFHPEFQEDYREINTMLDQMNNEIVSSGQKEIIRLLKDQKIALNSCARNNTSFVPFLPKWLAEDIKTVAMIVHMNISDTAYLYLVMGIINSDAVEMSIAKIFIDDMQTVVDLFRRKLGLMHSMCEHAYMMYDMDKNDDKNDNDEK